ncbi:PepSY-associated TM helix domain-containing protein [Colwellia sp. 1_MG-2023]|uniref:PepSY-associated TM helix domain-containing protein n=1 Tax=unclassified Colwellia TaxID=196834 RepID=UPI001C09DE94|nr:MULTISPECIES: PepSY-associated TM helix domain-containing protein [unclassified Colwellia]MBU2924977.1 PepSY-associated TM helix domain-containing protein [Colwellia sp. C2M11]MDO6652790.1 PepSY-associated TM helix domain-containing protein [Colwellia sp. 3_MG-2023]MDO6665793.1 PepSY-associated TM helix domain-containing protein [Colwellia sp. 2_MG-2023]MDO6690166.1 PepSY-associated TM helix domain-containing protein [Colwellia sp. 1_MG-2023]
MKIALGNARQWHWISAAICSIGMLFFSWTGITLNHAGDIPANSDITTIETELPESILQAWRSLDKHQNILPNDVREYLAGEHNLTIKGGLQGELSDGEFYLAMPNPGVDAWLSVDIESGELIYERTDRGWISFFNDLHKGRYTNEAWRWFIDIFAVISIVFCLSGLWLLYKQSGFRLSTWPMVSLGVLLPLIIILMSLH